MKYLTALLQAPEKLHNPREDAPTEPTKLVSSVLSGAQVGGTQENRLPSDPPQDPEAVTWLKEKLTPGPQHIALLIAEWVGTLNKPTGRNVDDLMQARWTLGVVPYVGADGRFWWRLPQDRVQ